MLIFAPNDIVETLGFRDFQAEYRMGVGLAWILSLSGLTVILINRIFQWTQKKIVTRRNLRLKRERLHDLTLEERNILQGYLKGGTRTQYLSIESGVVQGLASEKIIYRAASVGSQIRGFAYNIQPWAWEYLHKNPDLINELARESHPIDGPVEDEVS